MVWKYELFSSIFPHTQMEVYQRSLQRLSYFLRGTRSNPFSPFLEDGKSGMIYHDLWNLVLDSSEKDWDSTVALLKLEVDSCWLKMVSFSNDYLSLIKGIRVWSDTLIYFMIVPSVQTCASKSLETFGSGIYKCQPHACYCSLTLPGKDQFSGCYVKEELCPLCCKRGY